VLFLDRHRSIEWEERRDLDHVDGGDRLRAPGSFERGFHRPLDGNGDSVATCDMGAYESGLSTFLPLYCAEWWWGGGARICA